MLLEVDGVTKEFGGRRVLDSCSLAVSSGSITGLIGPNGAGKTTLFNLITGFLRPEAGQIRFRGVRIDGQRPDRIARQGLVRTFQVPREFKAMSVIENLMLVGRRQRGERIWNTWLRPRAIAGEEAALYEKALGILAFLNLETLAGELAGNLSVGQKKLLELGRGLMADPTLFLLDEPGAGVNPTLLSRIGEYILELRRRGMTFFLIEHNIDLVMRLCDRVIVLTNGTRLTEGTPEAVRGNPAVIEAYLGG